MRGMLPLIGCAVLVLCGTGAGEGSSTTSEDAYLAAKTRYVELAPDADSKQVAAAIGELAKTAVACGESASNPARIEARSLLRKRLGTRKQPPETLVAVLDAYGALAIPKSSKDLRRLLDRKAGRKLPLSVRKAAVVACAKIHDPGTHEYLFKLLVLPTDSADDREVAKTCATEVRRYKAVPRKHRYKLLDAFMKAFNSIQGAAGGAVMASANSTEWWEAIKDPMVASFNEMTEQKCKSFHDCARWWKANKRAVKAGKA